MPPALTASVRSGELLLLVPHVCACCSAAAGRLAVVHFFFYLVRTYDSSQGSTTFDGNAYISLFYYCIFCIQRQLYPYLKHLN